MTSAIWQSERDLILRLHRTKEDTPKNGIVIDAIAPLDHVVDEIVRRARQSTAMPISLDLRVLCRS